MELNGNSALSPQFIYSVHDCSSSKHMQFNEREKKEIISVIFILMTKFFN